MKQKVRLIATLMLTVMLAASLYMVVRQQLKYRESAEVYQSAAQLAKFQTPASLSQQAGSGVRLYSVFAAWEPSVISAVYSMDNSSEEKQQEFLDVCLDGNQLDTGIVPSPEDRVLILSTCTGRGHQFYLGTGNHRKHIAVEVDGAALVSAPFGMLENNQFSAPRYGNRRSDPED